VSSASALASVFISSSSDPEDDLALDAFLDGFFSSESESDPEEEEAAFLAAFLGAGFSSEESLSLEESFLAAFFAGAAFLTGFSSDESLSELEESFLAAFLAGAFFTSLTDSDESESEELSCFFAFLTGVLPLVELALLLALAAERALALLAAGFLSDSLLESLSEEEETTTFLAFFLSSDFLDLFFSSMLCFLEGGSEELALICFLVDF